MFLNTFRSIERRRNAIRDDFRLRKECHNYRHLQNDRNIYIHSNMKPYEYLNLKQYRGKNSHQLTVFSHYCCRFVIHTQSADRIHLGLSSHSAVCYRPP